MPHWIFATTQGSTLAGLQLGCELLGLPTRVVGICPMTAAHEAYLSSAEVAALVQGAASLLGFTSKITADRIMTTTDYVGDGFGVPSAGSLAAIRRLGAAEGILLDPVFSGKGFAGMLDYCQRGIVEAGDRIVFLHTGGLPALFSHAEYLVGPPDEPQSS
jgi:1-aminocyclopropane-1-carboxylate deaminase/D-cysteine desulfhydrase-like pyridoxal-dependent ACC family enzyme